MTRIAIVGGHGKIARLLIALLVDAGHQPVALVRNPAHVAELERLGAEVGLLDVERDTTEAFAGAFAGAGAIVFAAGGGADGDAARKKTVDLGGSVKSIEAAGAAGVRRFVQISAISVDEPLAPDTDPVWVAYVEAKRDADAALRDSDLDWTIIRPGALTDTPPTGTVTIADTVTPGAIPRADVAAVIAAVLDDPTTYGAQWEVVGGSTPIRDAITAAVAAG